MRCNKNTTFDKKLVEEGCKKVYSIFAKIWKGVKMETKLFKSKMALFGDTSISLAKRLKIHRLTLTEKINGKSDFKQSEISFLIGHWNLTASEVVQIFFNEVE